jgi:acyl carrier protein
VSSDDPFLERVRAVIERTCGPRLGALKAAPSTPLADGFWLDSVDLLEVLVACETEFGIVFDESEDLTPERVATLQTLTNLIRSKLAGVSS